MNSRPLPQRLQVPPPHNGTDAPTLAPHGPCPPGPNDRTRVLQNAGNSPTESHSAGGSGAGFQIYSRPPGPANHVPLSPRSPFLDKSSSASLPRCFPRTSKLVPPPPPTHATNAPMMEAQQPLSVIVQQQQQQNEYAKRSQANGHQPSSHKRNMPMPDHNQYYGPGSGHHERTNAPIHTTNGELPVHRSPYVNLNPPRDPARSNSLQRNYKMNYDPRHFPDSNPASIPPRRPSYDDSSNHREAFHYQNGTKHNYNGPVFKQFQHPPRRENLPEPVVSMRMGKLGTYPDTPSHRQQPSKAESSNHILKCADSEPLNQYPVPPQDHVYRYRQDTQDRMRQQYQDAMQPQPRSYGQADPNSYQNTTDANKHHYPSYRSYSQQYNQNSDKNHYPSPISPPPVPMSRRPLENGQGYPKHLPPDSNTYSNYNGQNNPLHSSSSVVQNDQKFHSSTEPSGSQSFNYRNPDDDYYRSSSHKNLCQTPEEAGLVMIVESLDINNQVNSVAKDLVKPKPRIPLSPKQTLPRIAKSPLDNVPYKNSTESADSTVDKYGGVPFGDAPLGRNGPTAFSYSTSQNGTEHSNGPWSSNAENRRAFQNPQPPTNPQLRSLNYPLLRRTPLSSSTASLSSEISSVSSKQWKPHANGANMRFPGSIKVMHSSVPNGKDKGNEISPSPWTREEKEERQKQQILGARQARDKEIAHLESLSERTEKQDEWLRILRLEQEFQRRAEEIGDDDEDDEEDEALLDRAEHRERMLLLEKEMAVSDRENSERVHRMDRRNISSSSDQWLANSQAKQSPKQTSADGSLLNTSFEVEQFNDLLETMNMSPVIRETCSSSQEEMKKNPASAPSVAPKTNLKSNESMTNGTADVFHTAGNLDYESGAHANKALSPPPWKSSTDFKSPQSPPADFCFPVESAQSFKFNKGSIESSSSISAIKNEDDTRNSGFRNKAMVKDSGTRSRNFADDNIGLGKTSPNNKPEYQLKSSSSDAILPKVDEKNQSKYAIRVPLSLATKEKDYSFEKKNTSDKREFLRSTSLSSSGYSSCENSLTHLTTDQKQNSSSTNKVSLRDKNTYYANSIQLSELNKKKRPTSDSGINSFLNHPLTKTSQKESSVKNTESGDKSSEYTKIWTSRPEKLTFLDKIKKFSQQAGEDNIPRDKVKNSRAQRELEIKFNGTENGRSVEQKAS